MAKAYLTFYFCVQSEGAPVLEESLDNIGRAAWDLVNKSVETWPARMATVQDHGMSLDVEVLELCVDDTGVCLDTLADSPAYCIGIYTEQLGLTCTPEHLEKVQAFCEQAFLAAAQSQGLKEVRVSLAQVESHTPVERLLGARAATLADWHKHAAEAYWVASEGEGPTQMYFNRAEAFKNGHAYVDAFDLQGKRLTAYALRPEFLLDNSSSEASYTSDF